MKLAMKPKYCFLYKSVWGCGPVVRLLVCHARAHSIPYWRESSATVYWTNMAPPQWTCHKLHVTYGTAESRRGSPITTVTQAVARGHTDGHMERCLASISVLYHAASVNPAVIGTW